MVSSCLYRGLKIIAALAPVALLPAGCADPCRECPKINCSGNDIDCSPDAMKCGDPAQSNSGECQKKIARCEANKKETISGCEQIKTMCFKSCKTPPPQ
jgi:hypothetical protein